VTVRRPIALIVRETERPSESRSHSLLASPASVVVVQCRCRGEPSSASATIDPTEDAVTVRSVLPAAVPCEGSRNTD